MSMKLLMRVWKDSFILVSIFVIGVLITGDISILIYLGLILALITI